MEQKNLEKEAQKLRQKVVEDFFKHISAGHVDGAMQLLDDTVIWYAMGGEGGLPMCGTRNKKNIAQYLKQMHDSMPQGVHFKPIGWTVQHERVAAEYHSHGICENGTIYSNNHHFLLYVQGGKITMIREYMDTMHANNVVMYS